jgi:MSHA biogenesis protein MshM
VIYLNHFGLREPPFGITPDTSFFFACASSQEGLNTLLVAVANGEGFIKITGEVGTGKTLLCRKLLATLSDNCATAYIPNPNLEPRTLLFALCDELDVEVEPDLDQHRLIKALNHALLDFARERRRVVICLDETQAMPLETLETLRLLTNLETEKRKLAQVILFGQPELDQKLAHESVRQLRQRITFQHHLGTLTREELAHYLAHRLSVAGYVGDGVFSGPAVGAIHRATRGVQRLVKLLAHKSMMLAFGEGVRQVRVRHARAAIADTPAVSSFPARHWAWLAMAGLVAGSGIGWLVLK